MGKTRRREPEVYADPKPDTGLPFELTMHAVERFRDRGGAAAMSFAASSRDLETLARTARRTEGRTRRGDEIWEAIDGSPVRFVVKKDGSRRICVTLLEPRPRKEGEVG